MSSQEEAIPNLEILGQAGPEDRFLLSGTILEYKQREPKEDGNRWKRQAQKRDQYNRNIQ